MDQNLLKRHLSGCHPELVDKDVLQRKGSRSKESSFRKKFLENQKDQASLRALYMVALRIT